MSEPMSALDKELLGENAEMANDGLEEATKVDQNITSKSENQIDGSDNNKHSVFGPQASATDKMEIDEKADPKAKDEVKPSPKKRGADVENGDAATPKKKRAPAKPKAVKSGDAGATQGVEAVTPKKKSTSAKAKKTATETAEGEADTNGNTIVVEPVTPQKKRTPAKSKASTPKVATDNAEAAGEDEITTTPKAKASPSKAKAANGAGTTRKRAPATGIAPSRGIPDCYENASNADKKLIEMKENGESWDAIRTAWKEETGQDTASSTLPNRYNRIKLNMMRLKDGEEAILLAAKETVERKFEHEKWALIATEMHTQGTDEYPVIFLQKQYKELTTARPVYGPTATVTEAAAASDDDDDAMAEE